ncbi:isoprenylcysteine carboxylmethyltransferase family protein [Methanobacterium sp. CWC-01]|uniref:methyltransferase family protein n=1 Tax=Methanobacterium aridiramus TaxID=2584467 RepID=UPI00257652D4|nr:isoprenylcysteine carboxylmethyltransferase family protein [Methanobacterium sp. CWC-01]WJI09268.1 isoprenylcysteine carboxylmethyltransferase family protein [Methanobacterium sp. CWC-01]
MSNYVNTLRYLLRLFLSLLAQAIIFFSAAGQLEIPRAWLFFALTFIYYVLSFIVLYRFNHELIHYRGGSAFRGDTKQWDKYILLIYTFLGVYGQFFVAGWDLGHIHWLYLGLEYMVVGIILFIISDVLIVWAMVQNPFFEPTVRIQRERGQKVIGSGPYQIVRHPGYLSGILWHLAMPLIFGSGLTLVYSLLIIVLLVVRTYLEDKTLQAELEGYQEYTRKTRYRILPGLW